MSGATPAAAPGVAGAWDLSRASVITCSAPVNEVGVSESATHLGARRTGSAIDAVKRYDIDTGFQNSDRIGCDDAQVREWDWGPEAR